MGEAELGRAEMRSRHTRRAVLRSPGHLLLIRGASVENASRIAAERDTIGALQCDGEWIKQAGMCVMEDGRFRVGNRGCG